MDKAFFEQLSAGFPPGDAAQWRALVERAPGGRRLDQLVGASSDALPILPLYPRAKSGLRVFRASAGAWEVAQRIDHPGAAEANELALADLEGGASALVLVFAGAPGAEGFGLAATSIDALDEILAGVELDLIGVRLESPGAGVAEARLLAGLAARRGLPPGALRIDFGCDPLGAALSCGSFGAADPGADVAELALDLAARGFAGTVAMADGRAVHRAGGTEAQELAHVLAAGLLHLRQFERLGLPLAEASRRIGFMLGADCDQFLGIAKFRAIRLLWARLEAACGLAPAPIRLHAETATRMLSRRDPYTNVLRTGMAVFAAGIGGADAVTALPFTSALGLPDAHARRMARNSQLVLLEEAHLAQVADAAAGAGGFEALTHGLCETAWGLFQEIESAGGIVAAIRAGLPQRRIAKAAATRAAGIASRRLPLIGVSEFPDLQEAPANVLMPFSAAPGTSAGDFFALAERRDAAPFESLRDAADAYALRMSRPPTLFCANLGSASGFAARASFAAGAFAAGGIEALPDQGFAGANGSTDLDALASAAAASGAPLACLCGSDAAYAAEAQAAFRLLAGRFRAIFIAGPPSPALPAGLRPVHAGSNLSALLAGAHASLEG